jgi:hypothetical protein
MARWQEKDGPLAEIQEAPKESLVIMTGPPATGKSTFCHQIALEAIVAKDPGPFPSFAGFPAEVRFAMNALIWYVESVFAGSSLGKGQSTEGSKFSGIAASPGKYTGPVCVIMSEAEFGKVQAGDVLVCPITSPAWSILFPSVGALITDTGGALSHHAIIARE